MADAKLLVEAHRELTRRYFLRLGSAGIAAWSTLRLSFAADPPADLSAQQKLDQAIAKIEYLTPSADFGNVGRGDPVPSELPDDQRRAVGLDRDTWQLEVVPDAESGAKVEQPLSKERGTAFNWEALMRLAEKSAVRYFKVMTCNNINAPLGMGLWEGVPLRDILWLARPTDNIRRVFYYGYHKRRRADVSQLAAAEPCAGRS